MLKYMGFIVLLPLVSTYIFGIMEFLRHLLSSISVLIQGFKCLH